MRALVGIGILLCVTAPTFADSSVAGGSTSLDKCTMEDGPLRRAWTQDRTRVEALGWIHSVGRRHLVVGKDKSPVTVVDREHLMKVARFEPEGVLGLIEDPSGKLLGVLDARAQQNVVQLKRRDRDGKVLWEARFDGFGEESVALVAGDLLVVANFHRIATGSSLRAFDLASGKLRWRADVEQLNVSHSKYWNDVSLERDGDRVVMRGFEASGCYRQVFELATGKRLLSQIAHR